MSTFLAVVLIVVAVFLLFVASRPATFTIRRTAGIAAPPETIFGYLNDFHRWGAWSPWEKLDPDLQRSYGGPDSGQGATYEWAGNKKVGRGRMEIMESVPPSRLTIRLDFIAPFEAHNTTVFVLEPAAGSTQVTWEMHGTNNFMGKLMGVFMNMDRMIGKDFEAGLANLRQAVEQR